jgi:hypothetical protein
VTDLEKKAVINVALNLDESEKPKPTEVEQKSLFQMPAKPDASVGGVSFFGAPKKDDGLFGKSGDVKPKDLFATGSLFTKPTESKPETSSLFNKPVDQIGLFNKPAETVGLFNKPQESVSAKLVESSKPIEASTGSKPDVAFGK